MHSDGLFGTNTAMHDVYGQIWTFGLNGLGGAVVSVLPNQLVSGDTHAQFPNDFTRTGQDRLDKQMFAIHFGMWW